MITIGALTFSPGVFWTWTIILVILIYRLVYLFLMDTLPIGKRKVAGEPLNNPISIVIPTKNSVNELMEILPLFLNQEYPNFEVIVIDQCSNDDTQNKVSKFKEKYPNLKITGYEQEVRFPRKLTFFLGLKASVYDWVIFLTPNSRPRDNKWLQNLSRGLHPGTDLLFLREEHCSINGIIDYMAKAQIFFRDLIQASFLSNAFIFNLENVAIRKKKVADFFISHNPCYPHPIVENLINKAAQEMKGEYISGLVTCDNQQLDWSDLLNIKENQLFIRKNLKKQVRFRLLFDEYLRIILLAAFIFALTLSSGKLYVPVAVFLLLLFKTWFFYKIKGAFNFKEQVFLHIYDFIVPFFGVLLKSRMHFKKQREKWI